MIALEWNGLRRHDMDAVKNNTEITIIIDEDHRLVQQTQVSGGHVLARIFPSGALARKEEEVERDQR